MLDWKCRFSPKLQAEYSQDKYKRCFINTFTCNTLQQNNYQLTPPPHHNRFTALYRAGSASVRRELLDFMVQGKINTGKHTDHLAGRHSIRMPTTTIPPFFYRPDSLPANQPCQSTEGNTPTVPEAITGEKSQGHVGTWHMRSQRHVYCQSSLLITFYF